MHYVYCCLHLLAALFQTLAMGYMTAMIASFYNNEIVFIAIGICAGSCLAISIFSFNTRVSIVRRSFDVDALSTLCEYASSGHARFTESGGGVGVECNLLCAWKAFFNVLLLCRCAFYFSTILRLGLASCLVSMRVFLHSMRASNSCFTLRALFDVVGVRSSILTFSACAKFARTR